MRVERYVNTAAFDVIFTLIHKQLLMHNELYIHSHHLNSLKVYRFRGVHNGCMAYAQYEGLTLKMLASV